MGILRPFSIATTVLLCCWTTPFLGQPAPSQTAASEALPTREAMLQTVTSLAATTELFRADTHPFHLKATIETFDPTGKSDGQGTIEAYWDGKDRLKRAIEYRGRTRTQYQTKNGLYTTGADFVPSINVNRLVLGFSFPLPNSDLLKTFDLSYKPTQSGTMELGCIITGPKAPAGAPANFAPEQSAYCLQTGTQTLRIAQLPQHVTLIYNDIKNFHEKHVPWSVDLIQATVLRARLRLSEISDWPNPDDASFALTDGAKVPSPIRTSGGVIAGFLIKNPSPVYPASAQKAGIAGFVVLHVLISRTGDVVDIEPISSPDDSLTSSALNAVRLWKYRPYLLNGEAVEVDTTVTVNFNLR